MTFSQLLRKTHDLDRLTPAELARVAEIVGEVGPGPASPYDRQRLYDALERVRRPDPNGPPADPTNTPGVAIDPSRPAEAVALEHMRDAARLAGRAAWRRLYGTPRTARQRAGRQAAVDRDMARIVITTFGHSPAGVRMAAAGCDESGFLPVVTDGRTSVRALDTFDTAAGAERWCRLVAAALAESREAAVTGDAT